MDDKIKAINSIIIPEYYLRATIDEYLAILEKVNPDVKIELEFKMQSQKYCELLLEHVRAAIIGATILLSLNDKTDFNLIVSQCFPSVYNDEIFKNLRNEIVTRSIRLNKDIPPMSKLTRDIINQRKNYFCCF